MTQNQLKPDDDYMNDLWACSNINCKCKKEEKIVIQEIMHDGIGQKHHLKEQTELHEKIRNDNDYDDWSYGTEPSFGKPQ
jgi:hypothetical protein